MTQEIWKDIQDYETLYAVSNFGRVKSFDRILRSKGGERTSKGKILKPQSNEHGYLMVGLSKNGICKNITIHRLVAKAFLSNMRNLTEVNHIDGNKTNNRVDNLEWTTHAQNMKHSQCILGFNVPKSVAQIKNGIEIAVFDSATDAQRKTGINKSSISSCCRNKARITAGGFQWKYKNKKGGDNEL